MAESRIPVFCTASVNIEKINAFLDSANKATSRAEFESPMGYLMTKSTIPDDVHRHTTATPVDADVLAQNEFIGLTAEEIRLWVQTNLSKSGLSSTNLVILDERTQFDDTCLLMSESDDDTSGWLTVRSDFESSIISLMVIETGVGDADILDTHYEGSDGILRISVRDRRPSISSHEAG